MIARLRAQVGGPVGRPAPDDPRRVAFGQLHLFSVVLLGVAMLAAALVLVLALRGQRDLSVH